VTLLVMHGAAAVAFRLRTPRGPDGGSAQAGPYQVGRDMMSRVHLFPFEVLAPEVVDEQRVHDLRGSRTVSQRQASGELRTVPADGFVAQCSVRTMSHEQEKCSGRAPSDWNTHTLNHT